MKQKQKKKQIHLQKKKQEQKQERNKVPFSPVEFIIILAVIAIVITFLFSGIQNAYDKRIYQREFAEITHETSAEQAWKNRKLVKQNTFQLNEQTKNGQYRVTFQHGTIVKMEEKIGNEYEIIFQKK